MNTNYANPAIRQLRDQQVRFAPREKKIEQANSAETLLGEIDPGRTYSYEYLCYRITKYRPESYPDLRLSGREASHDLRLFVEDVSDAADVASSSRRRARDDRRGAEPAVQRVDQDHFPLAATGAGESPLRVRRPQAGGLPPEFRRPVREAKRGPRATRSPVQPAHRRRTRPDHRAGAASGRGRRLPGRRHQATRPTNRPKRRDDPLHDQAVRPRTPRHGHLPDTATVRCRRRRRRRSTSTSGGANRSRRWPSGSAARKTSIYRIVGEMRAQRIMELPAGLHVQRAVRPGRRREGREGDSGLARRGSSSRRARPGFPAACPPTWPASTRCRC